MKTPCKNLWPVLIIQILLAGCGFTTRNINSLPPQLSPAYYQAEHPYEPFEASFKKRLKATGVILLFEPQKSSPIIKLSSNFSYTTNNPSPSVEARIYNLNYTATISISDFYNKELLAPKVATVSRSITLQPNEVFEATPQIAIIKREMQQELSTRVFNILSAPKTFQALAT